MSNNTTIANTLMTTCLNLGLYKLTGDLVASLLIALAACSALAYVGEVTKRISKNQQETLPEKPRVPGATS